MDHAEARLVAAHIVRALARHEVECRRNATAVPAAVPLVRELLESLATMRQDATPLGDLGGVADGEPMTPALLTKREVAVSLRCSVRTVERLLAAGAMAAVQMGGRTLIRPADLAAYVESMAARSTFRESIESKRA